MVLDVPAEVATIHNGFYLGGAGQVWARGFDLTAVADDVTVTSDGGKALSALMNLDFAEAATGA
jgi:hypothetical protein